MKILDALLGRTKPKQANLDALFALSTAAVTLEAGFGLKPSGRAAVCFKPASGQTFAEMRKELEELLQMSTKQSGTELSEEDDTYGYHWVTLRDPDLEDLVGAVHLVNASLEDREFGSQLLCSVFAFGVEQRSAFLVYLYKRGTFYPFAPIAAEHRDNELELRLRGILENDLPIESDLSRWYALWGVPI